MTDKNIYQRINACMADAAIIEKTKPKDKEGMKYSFVSHDDVAEMMKPLFKTYGIATKISIKESEIIQFNAVKQGDNKKTESTAYLAKVKMDVDFINIDKPEDKMTTEGWIGMGLDSQDKAPGKATTYALKYCLLKTFLLESRDDVEDDQKTNYTKKDALLQGSGHMDKEDIDWAREQAFEQCKEGMMGSTDINGLNAIYVKYDKLINKELPEDKKAELRRIFKNKSDSFKGAK